MRTRLPHAHVALSACYLASRLALYAAGLRFSFALDWMWLADPTDLRDRLAETLYYFHAFPPGSNAGTGLLLKLAGGDAAGLAQIMFWAMGVVVVNALFYLARAVGLSVIAASVFALAFTLTPPVIYFEHLFHYEWPVLTLLLAAAALFHRATVHPTVRSWSAFFTVCAAVGFTRSTYHLVWLLGVAAFAWLSSASKTRRSVAAAALVPVLLLSSLYWKNCVLFGDFAASTFGPASYTLVTVGHLPPDARQAWIRDGRLSPFADMSVYAPPRDYARFFPQSHHDEWPPQLTRLDHPSVNAANFNHWWLLEIHRTRRRDAMRYLRDRPLDYVANVRKGLQDFFGPSTTWHPRDRTSISPHYQHRQVLGAYERSFNRAVHSWPVRPAGLYVLLPVLLIGATAAAWRLRQSDESSRRARGALLGFLILHIVYVMAASSMLTYLESSRYRFQIEPMVWLIATGCITLLIDAWRAKTWRRRAVQVF